MAPARDTADTARAGLAGGLEATAPFPLDLVPLDGAAACCGPPAALPPPAGVGTRLLAAGVVCPEPRGVDPLGPTCPPLLLPPGELAPLPLGELAPLPLWLELPPGALAVPPPPCPLALLPLVFELLP